MTHLIVYYVRTACFAISAITPNEHFQNKPEKVFIPRKVPGSVLIFNWTKKGLEAVFLASASASIRSASTRQRQKQRGFCASAKAD